MITRRLIVPFYQRSGYEKHLETKRFIEGLTKYTEALLIVAAEDEAYRIKRRRIKT